MQIQPEVLRCQADTKRVKPSNCPEPTFVSKSVSNSVSNSASNSGSKSLAVPGQRFVARQPILDRTQKVFGYELLFRNGIEDYFNADPDLAARSMLDSSLLFGLSTLCHNSRAFLNCTREILLRDLITLLPPSQTVVEIDRKSVV